MKKIIAVVLIALMPIFSLPSSVVFADNEPVKDTDQDEQKAMKTNAPNEESTFIEEPVVVTAYRTAVPSKLNPASTEVINVADAVRYGDNEMTSLFGAVNGVSYQTNGISGPASLYIRGTNAEHTLVLLDGLKLNDPISTGGGFYYYNHLSLTNIATVEIARGPFSSVYGSDAIGGVVNMMTRRGTGKPTASYSQTIGSYGTFDEMVEAQGAVGGLGFSCGFSREDVHHMYSAERRNGNFERDPYANMNFSGRLDYTLTENVEVSAFGRYVRADYEYDAGANSDNEQYKGDFALYIVGASVKHSVNDYISHTVTVGYTDMTRKNWTGSALNWFSGDTYQLRWDAEITPVEWDKLQIGVDYIQEAGESYSYGFRNLEETTNSKGIFVQNICTPFENLFLSGNIRVEDHSRYEEKLTYGFSGSYSIEPTRTKIKALWGTAFKSPGIYQLYDGFAGYSALKPEESKSLDVGFEQEIGERVSCGSTFFYTKIDDLIDYDMSASAYRNIKKARIYGWENFISCAVHETTKVKLLYTYMQTKDEESDKRLPRRPDHALTLSVQTQYKQFSCKTDISYIGSRKNSNYDAIKNKSYVLGTVGMAYDINKNLSIFGRAENIFDYHYVLANGYETRGRGYYGGMKLAF